MVPFPWISLMGTINYVPPAKPTFILRVGDLVCYDHPYHNAYAMRRRQVANDEVLGVITRVRKERDETKKEYMREWEAEVLCATGKLMWYSMSTLRKANEDHIYP